VKTKTLLDVPGNANQLVDSTTSCWETWLAFWARWGATALATRCQHVSQRALAKQIDWPRWTKWPGVLQVAPETTGPDLLWLFPLGVREGQSPRTSTTRNRGWAAGTHHCSCQLGHAGYAAESLVRARLSHRCLPSNKRGGTLSVWDTTWNCMSLCNCSHQFCKNIPVSFDFITTWNQGVFLCSPCTLTQKLNFHFLTFWSTNQEKMSFLKQNNYSENKHMLVLGYCVFYRMTLEFTSRWLIVNGQFIGICKKLIVSYWRDRTHCRLLADIE